MKHKINIGDVVYHCWKSDVIGYVVKVEDEWVYARTLGGVDFDCPLEETLSYDRVVLAKERDAENIDKF